MIKPFNTLRGAGGITPNGIAVRSHLCGVLTGCTTIFALVVTSASVDAATITVNTFSQVAAGLCTIATAIASVNAGADQTGCTHSGTYGTSDTIVLAAGTYALTTADNGTNGFPIIAKPVTINGNGATLSRTVGGSAPFFRFFEVGAGGLTLTNATLTGGNVPSGVGGAILVDSGAVTLTVSLSIFSGNSASGGVGGAIADNATTAFSINNSTFSGNSASSGVGGAVYDNTSFGLTVTNTTFTGNSAGAGGAVYDNSGTGLTINNSTFTANTAPGGSGGAIYDNSTAGLVFTGGTVANNSVGSGGSGGGIYDNSESGIRITNVSFSANSASGGAGGAIFDNSSVGTGPVSNNCFVGDTATSGGGIFRVITTLNAINNWWGAASGPSGSGPGTGDQVNSHVTFAPFLTSPPSGCLSSPPPVPALPEGALLLLALLLMASGMWALRRRVHAGG